MFLYRSIANRPVKFEVRPTEEGDYKAGEGDLYNFGRGTTIKKESVDQFNKNGGRPDKQFYTQPW